MPSLTRTHPVVGASQHEGLRIELLAGLDKAMVRCPRAAAAATASLAAQACGLVLPLMPNTVSETGDMRALWLERGAWLVTGPEKAPAARLAPLPAEARAFVLIVDMSSGYCGLRLSGPRARAVIQAGCPLDLHPDAFGPGRCASSLYEDIPVIVEQLDDEPTWRLLCDRSRAAALLDALGAAADLAP